MKWREAGLRVRTVTGAELHDALDDVAALRITVFREFPYLYDGDLVYERDYLAGFAEAAGAVVVLARDDERVVGAATGVPMMDAEPEWSAPFRAAGRDIGKLFYCAESVLLPQYRGLGVGHAFFDRRENHARDLGMAESCFASVMRPGDHPARPADHRPHDAFWQKRGYAPLDGIVARYGWRDIGVTTETDKPLQFWGRRL